MTTDRQPKFNGYLLQLALFGACLGMYGVLPMGDSRVGISLICMATSGKNGSSDVSIFSLH